MRIATKSSLGSAAGDDLVGEAAATRGRARADDLTHIA